MLQSRSIRWIVLVVLAASAALWLLRRARQTHVVIGRELAAAKQAEAARLASASFGPSPMPKESYDGVRGDYDLTSVTALPLDASLQALTTEFKGWDFAKRRDARGAISMDEFNTLLAFARRSAALALKESSRDRCEAGLLALAMIDETRIDWRDAAVAAALLAHGVAATGGARDELFAPAIALATSGMGAILSRQKDSNDLSAMGYAELRTGTRVGFIASEWSPYAPTVNLTGIALGIADAMNRGQYLAHNPTIATKLPSVWFAAEHQDAAQKLLERAHGTVLVGAAPRDEHGPLGPAVAQQWIAEMPTVGDAEQLVDYVGPGTGGRNGFSLGIACGRLFVLLMVGPYVRGGEPVGWRESLAKLGAETRVVLESFPTTAGSVPAASH
jgi:hypothetical protein